MATWDELAQFAKRGAEYYGVDPNDAFALFEKESSWDPGAISEKGAIGVGQLMPGTAKDLNVNPHDPLDNIDGSLRYFKQQLDKFGGDRSKAFAAYNAGPGAVEEAKGIPSFAQDYVNDVLSRSKRIARQREESGFVGQWPFERPSENVTPEQQASLDATIQRQREVNKQLVGEEPSTLLARPEAFGYGEGQVEPGVVSSLIGGGIHALAPLAQELALSRAQWEREQETPSAKLWLTEGGAGQVPLSPSGKPIMGVNTPLMGVRIPESYPEQKTVLGAAEELPEWKVGKALAEYGNQMKMPGIMGDILGGTGAVLTYGGLLKKVPPSLFEAIPGFTALAMKYPRLAWSAIHGIPAAGLGAATMQPGGYEAAREFGKTPEEAAEISRWNALVGTSMAIPLTKYLSMFDRFAKGTASNLVLEATKGGLSMAGTMGFMNVANNFVDKMNYDEKRELLQGVIESVPKDFAIGVLSFGLGAATAKSLRADARARNEPVPDEVGKFEDKTQQFEEQGIPVTQMQSVIAEEPTEAPIDEAAREAKLQQALEKEYKTERGREGAIEYYRNRYGLELEKDPDNGKKLREVPREAPVETPAAPLKGVAAHGTDIDMLEGILQEGLKPGSAIDLTPDRGWAGEYPIQVEVIGAGKGRYVAHNNYWTSANKGTAKRVIVDLEQYTDAGAEDVLSRIDALKKRFPNIAFDVKGKGPQEGALTRANLIKYMKERYDLPDSEAATEADFHLKDIQDRMPRQLGYTRSVHDIEGFGRYLDWLEEQAPKEELPTDIKIEPDEVLSPEDQALWDKIQTERKLRRENISGSLKEYLDKVRAWEAPLTPIEPSGKPITIAPEKTTALDQAQIDDQIVEMREDKKLDYAEIGKQMNMSAQEAKKRYKYATGKSTEAPYEVEKGEIVPTEKPEVVSPSIPLTDISDLITKKEEIVRPEKTVAKPTRMPVVGSSFEARGELARLREEGIIPEELGAVKEIPGTGKWTIDPKSRSTHLFSLSPNPFDEKWYSRLNEAVAIDYANWPKRMNGEEAIRKMQDLIGQGKAKKEELDDRLRLTGLKDRLLQMKGESRDDILNEIMSNNIEVDEIWYGLRRERYPKADRINELAEKRDAETITEAEQYELIELGQEEMHWDNRQEERAAKYAEHENFNLKGEREGSFELVLWSPQAEELPTDPSHYAEGKGRKLIAWARVTWRTDAEGKRGINLEEVQSRHQKGRAEGYAQPISLAAEAAIKEARQVYAQALEELTRFVDNAHLYEGSENEWIEERARLRENELLTLDRLNLLEANRRSQGTVPDAPFRQSWIRLVARRLLRYAAENDADFISWTTGEQQAERWSLRQVADELKYIPSADGKTGDLIARKDGEKVFHEEVARDKLPEYVGRELADKLLNPPERKYELIQRRKPSRFHTGEWIDVLSTGLTREEAEAAVERFRRQHPTAVEREGDVEIREGKRLDQRMLEQELDTLRAQQDEVRDTIYRTLRNQDYDRELIRAGMSPDSAYGALEDLRSGVSAGTVLNMYRHTPQAGDIINQIYNQHGERLAELRTKLERLDYDIQGVMDKAMEAREGDFIAIPEGVDFYSSKWPEEIYGFQGKVEAPFEGAPLKVTGGYEQGLLGLAMKEAMGKFREEVGETVAADSNKYAIETQRKYIESLQDTRARYAEQEGVNGPNTMYWSELLRTEREKLATIAEKEPFQETEPRQFSVQPSVRLTPEAKKFWSQNPFALFSLSPNMANPENVQKLKEILVDRAERGGIPKDITRAYLADDMWKLSKWISQPQWLVDKDYPLRRIFGSTLKRQEKAATDLENSVKEWANDWIKASAESKKAVTQFLVGLDGKPYKDIEQADGTVVPGMGITVDKFFKKKRGSEITINPEHHRQWREKVAEFFPGTPEELELAYQMRVSLDKALEMRWNSAKKFYRRGSTAIKQLRQEVFEIPNYFPHSRTGEWVVRGYIGDRAVYDGAFDIPPLLYNLQSLTNKFEVREIDGTTSKGVFKTRDEAEIALKKAGDKYEIVDAGKRWIESYFAKKVLPKLNEDPILRDLGIPEKGWKIERRPSEYIQSLSNQPLLAIAIQNTVDRALKELGKDPNVKPEMLTGWSKLWNTSVAETLKKSSYGGHWAKRKDIYGYDVSDAGRVIYEYMQQFHNTLAKAEMASDLMELARQVKGSTPNRAKWAANFIDRTLNPNTDMTGTIYGLRQLAYWTGINPVKFFFANSTNSIVGAAPQIAIDAGTPAAWKNVLKAYKDVAAWSIGKGKLSEDEVRLLTDLHDSGVVRPQFLDAVSKQIKSDPTARSMMLEKAKSFLSWPTRTSEVYTRMTAALAAYRVAKAGLVKSPRMINWYGEGITEKAGEKPTDAQYQLYKEYAGEIVDKSHMIWGEANRPEIVTQSGAGRLASSALIFRHYAQGLLHMWHSMAKEKNGTFPLVQSIVAQSLLGGLPLGATLAAIYNKLTGSDAWDDLKKKIGGSAEAVRYGLPALAGLSLHSSFDMDPPSSWDELVGVPASIIKNYGNAWSSVGLHEYSKAMEYTVPLKVARDALVGRRLYTTGLTTAGGKAVNIEGKPEPYKITGLEAVGQAAGFTPHTVTKLRDVRMSIQNVTATQQTKQNEFVTRYVNALRAGNTNEMTSIIEEAVAWNDKWLAKGMPQLTVNLGDGIKSRMRPPRTLKQMRGTAREMGERWME